jgi:hypothetical protein
MGFAMIAWTIRCPVCTSSNCRRSQSGWLRHLVRGLFIFPLRCRHCQTRFWRLTLSPPPFARPKKPVQTALPDVAQDSDHTLQGSGVETPPPVGQGGALIHRAS